MTVVSVFCNAVSHPGTVKGACGRSTVVVPTDSTDETLPALQGDTQGAIWCHLNPFKSLSRPTKTNETEPNAVLVSCILYEFKWGANSLPTLIPLETNNKEMRRIVNPQVLQHLGLKKVYGLLRLRHYLNFKLELQKRFYRLPSSSISVFGVYGIHDVICSSWEEFFTDEGGAEYLRLRLWPVLTESDLDPSRLATCVVNRFIKFRGVVLTDTGSINPVITPENETELRRILYSLLTSNQGLAAEARIQEGLEKMMISTEYSTSDISQNDLTAGKLEFLIVIKLFAEPAFPRKVSNMVTFEEKCMRLLINDERVRTIEQVTCDSQGSFEGNYILHFVGTIAELNGFVINQIHDSCGKLLFPDIECSTQVIIPAERLSINSFPGLAETPKMKSTEPTLTAIVKEWQKMPFAIGKEEFVPTAIYLLSAEQIRLLLQSYYLADLLRKDKDGSGDWIKDFHEFLYAVTVALHHGSGIPDLSHDRFIRMCSRLVQTIGKEMEKLFGHIIRRVKYPTETVNSTLQIVASVLNKDIGRISVERPQLGTISYVIEVLLALKQQKYREAFSMAVKAKYVDNAKALEIESCLSSMANAFDALLVKGPLSEVRQFAENCRNVVSHSDEQRPITPAIFVECVFFGLRFLERLMLLESVKTAVQANVVVNTNDPSERERVK
jgi:hypothetical protein